MRCKAHEENKKSGVAAQYSRQSEVVFLKSLAQSTFPLERGGCLKETRAILFPPKRGCIFKKPCAVQPQLGEQSGCPPQRPIFLNA